MRTKIATIVALASFWRWRRLGPASPGPTRCPEAPRGRPRPTTTTAVPPLQPPACANGVDDDGDGLIDLADPDCSSPGDDSEAPEPARRTDAAAGAARQATRSGGARRPATAARSAATAASGSGGGVVHNESLGDAQRRQRQRRRRAAPRARPAAATSRWPKAATAARPSAPAAPRPLANPTTTIAPFGPAPIGVPNFVIDSFEIPPFLLPIYQACGTEYGIPWEVLASINKIETGFGTNLNVSSAGAVGWMQFLPSSWETYGLDANGDGRKDPYNPVDAICAAAHYLKIAGGTKDLYNAILAYNHADWYVQEVLLYARAYGRLPSDLVGSLTGLTEGAHFPIAANARYADDISARAALKSSTPGSASSTATPPK